jgi:hypothetical protein
VEVATLTGKLSDLQAYFPISKEELKTGLVKKVFSGT